MSDQFGKERGESSYDQFVRGRRMTIREGVEIDFPECFENFTEYLKLGDRYPTEEQRDAWGSDFIDLFEDVVKTTHREILSGIERKVLDWGRVIEENCESQVKQYLKNGLIDLYRTIWPGAGLMPLDEGDDAQWFMPESQRAAALREGRNWSSEGDEDDDDRW